MPSQYIPARPVPGALAGGVGHGRARNARGWLMLVSLLAPGVMAQQAGGFDAHFGRTTSGGGATAGGVFEAQGTIGDSAAGGVAAAGGNFSLQGGFQSSDGSGAGSPANLIFSSDFD